MKRFSLRNTLKAAALMVFTSFLSCESNPERSNLGLVPLPQQVEVNNGTFTLRNGAKIAYADDALQPAANYLAELLSVPTGYKFEVVKGSGDINLMVNAEGKEGSYSLEISSGSIQIAGSGYQGVVYGIQTLRQLFNDQIESKSSVASFNWTVPQVKIADAPRYQWRGLMLDVSRHFFSKEEVKELLNLMSLYKMNKFHWHLTDDQGWRVEIKQYPLLTEKGAFRHFNAHDRRCMELMKEEDNTDYRIPAEKLSIVKGDTIYGGYYTQDDIREIVAYAAVRGIDIVPEIDMPGHMLAAVGNYKGLACSDRTGWGETFSSPLCPGKDKAIAFCKNVYKEIFDLFPYKYVHIGGDEVDKTNWKKCPDCQRRMKQLNLDSEAKLQAWFNHEMEAYFNANGKEMIGWDEIEEGGLSETSTVMWWRSWAKGMSEKVTAQGNKIIYTPNTAFYLDYQQDKNSVSAIYNFNPDLETMTQAQKDLIMGVQGNIWCEWIPSRERLLYMAAPRMLAIAELGWSSADTKDWNCFQNRMVDQFDRLRVMNVNYRIPDIDGFYNSNAFIGEGEVDLSCIDPNAEIRYTVDGTIPTADSKKYESAFKVDQTTSFVFRTFRKEGGSGDFVKTQYISDSYSAAVDSKPANKGLQAAWYEYNGDLCSEIETAPFKGNYIVDTVGIPEEAKGKIGLIITGYINVPADDMYTFYLKSDDGSILKIDDIMVVDNDGAHAPREIIGQKALKAGLHQLLLRYFDHNGGMLHMDVYDSKGNLLPVEGLYCH